MDEGLSFREAARRFLVEQGLIGDAGADDRGAAGAGRREGLGEFVIGRLGVTARLAGEHIANDGGTLRSVCVTKATTSSTTG